MKIRQIVTQRILELCNSIPQQLRLLSDTEFSLKPSPAKWSKKEILGHLIDSAAANLQRFIRGQFETPQIYYEQDLCVAIQNFQEEEKELLISFWEIYNRHLCHVIMNIPDEKLQNECIYKDGSKASLSFLIEDYLTHLEHHLNQIL